ncbi:MBL fold metallo-hydrolase [Enterovibrio nigricans]|uniref:Metallo-beta-lactamase superfamily protein n=1 Tax=Enterovibrio nigricans DSM 22720 TaxID=1121868 RepID=A0A1T4U5B4_9GAMM|nr:MBL fold metallo-hydrolase [Enterovibrio nigricans]SKA47857.1 Metallo-beta-lactamase superfamily protein [Enterovibrio nigricans DSM 22720]
MSDNPTLHEIEGYIQTIYLAEYQKGLMLLDGCSRADVGVVLSYIQHSLMRPIEDLKWIIVTHMHPDHAGGAHRLRDITGCQIATGVAEQDWYKGFDGIMMHWTDIALAKWMAKRMGKSPKRVWYNRRLNADAYLKDGDAIPGFPDWTVLETPGHTDRDISLHHAATSTVYVADLMVTVKGKFIPPFPVFYPNRYRQSLQKVFSLQTESIMLAHGGKVSPTPDDIDFLTSKIPPIPVTHWRSVKTKLKKLVHI